MYLSGGNIKLNEMLHALRESYSVFLNTFQESYCNLTVSRHLPVLHCESWSQKKNYRKTNWNLYKALPTNTSQVNLASNPRNQLNSALPYISLFNSPKMIMIH